MEEERIEDAEWGIVQIFTILPVHAECREGREGE